LKVSEREKMSVTIVEAVCASGMAAMHMMAKVPA